MTTPQRTVAERFDVALARAGADCEIAMGASWVWNPARWGTHDGYVDYHTLLEAVESVARSRAVTRLSVATAIRMGMGAEGADRLIKSDDALVRGEADAHG